MSKSFRIADGKVLVVKEGIKRLDTSDSHMVVLSRVVGTHSEPQRNGSRWPEIDNNVNIDETITIDSCHPKATHLIGRLVITLGTGSSYDPAIPPGKPYTFMGGTFVYAHMYDWFAGYTIFVDNGAVKLRRRIRSTYSAPDSGVILFNLRAFTIDYALRAVRFL
jgi:hypothetical protein